MPDATVIAMVEARMAQPDCARGVIFDGFPRTVGQAEALKGMLAGNGRRIDAVVEFAVDDAILIERVRNRAAEDAAAGKPVRPDDTPDVFPNRLAKYHKDTAPLIAYYRAEGLLKSVDGMRPMDEVTAQIEGALEAV